MTTAYSTALQNRILGGGSGDDDLKSLFAEGFIVIYAGAVPDVDSVSVGTVLCILSQGSATPGAASGLNLGTDADGAIPKDSDTWSGLVDNGGALAATYYRWVQNASAASAANVETEAAVIGTTALRMQGTIGTTPAFDMVVSNPVLADASTLTVASASLYF
jgi:hypothetical protein